MSNDTVDQQRKRHEWTLGLVLLAIVVILWVLSSFLVNDLFDKDIYLKPFLITYLNTTTFIFYLVPYLFKNLRSKLARMEYTEISNDKLTLRETIKLSAQFCILWYLSNLATNASLVYTSVSSQTILSSTLSFFTLIIGFICQVEKINLQKIFGLVLSMFGIILVNKFDFNNSKSIIVGNIYALCGAAGYGIYSILLKLKVKNDSNMNFQIFFGFVGLFNLIILWVPLIFLDYYDIETLEWPHDSYTYKILIINGLITFISDYFWAKAMILTSPLTITVGLSLTIPLAMFGDFFIKQQGITFIYLLGALIIGVSFIIINNDEEIDLVVEVHHQGNYIDA